MIKRIILLTLIIIFNQSINSMNPGPPILVKCPHCGEDKELMSLASGNTFGSIVWSDSYQYAPMLPRLSPVQKCLHCDSYFMLPDEKPRYKEGGESLFDYSFETGRLSFKEIKEALLQLENTGLNKNEEIALRFESVYRFNDAFREFESKSWENVESKGKSTRDENDWQFHTDNLLRIVALLDQENPDHLPLIAEFYREAGKFDESINVIETFTPDSDFIKGVIDQIKEKALAKDKTIFVLQ